MMAAAEQRFKAALKVIENLPKTGSYKPSPEMMLSFYAYYKQATVGRCNRSKPWSFDVINKAKWDAWNRLGDMKKEEAMENYVKELTKVMREFPPPTDDQIIEALPASDKAANFVQTLDKFYEIVDPESENAGKFKEYTKSKCRNGKPSIPNGSSTNGISNNYQTENEPIATTSQTNNGFHDEATDAAEENVERESLHDNVASFNHTVATKLATPDGHQSLNESDEEFCDTSANMTQVGQRFRESSGSQSTPSTMSSMSLNGSPQQPCESVSKRTVDMTSNHREAILTRGGEHGTHGIYDPVQLNDGRADRGIGSDSHSVQENPALRRLQPDLSGSGGSGGDRNPTSGDRQSEVQERIAVALLQLQRDMHSVLNRLTTLETITISRHQDIQHCHRCCLHGAERKEGAWRLFDELSPRATLFILAWPFLARMLVFLWRKSRRSTKP